jgi:hypothetical protein
MAKLHAAAHSHGSFFAREFQGRMHERRGYERTHCCDEWSIARTTAESDVQEAMLGALLALTSAVKLGRRKMASARHRLDFADVT